MTTELRAPALSDVELVSLDALELHPDNPRQGDLGAIVTSIETNGWFGTLVAQRSTRRVLVGNHRLRAAQLVGLEEVPVHWIDVDEATARRILLADNRTSDLADYDRQDLAALLREAAEADDLLGTGFDAEDLDDLLLELGQGAGEDAREAAAGTLQQRFGLFPSSVLDTRRSWWQERKRAWLALGVRSELGRGDDLLSMPVQMRDPAFYAKRTAKEAELGREISTEEFREEFWSEAEATFIGTSIFDPVLCEIAYRWFCPPAGRVLDPFAGGSVRGIVAALLGRSYTGVDLRTEQLEANRINWSEVSAGAPGLTLEDETSRLVVDPEELTPIDLVELPGGGEVWVKRDDLFDFAGVRGSKARAGRAIAMSSAGLSAASSRNSTMLGRVARLAEAVGIPARIHIAPAKSRTAEELDAIAHGAELVAGKAGYLRTLVGWSRADAAGREGWTHIELGLESDTYTEINRGQAANIPAEAERIVVCVGSGNGLATVLLGLEDAGLAHIPVLGVMVGIDPTALLDRRAPEGWRERLELVAVETDYKQPAEATALGPIDLDPYYEAKCLPYLRPGDLFYVLARRSVDSAEVEAQEPEWIVGDSADLEELVAGRQFDMAFSCPPYFDLEVYSTDPADLSNCDDLEQFRSVHSLIIEQTVAALADDSFIVWVIGEARGPSAAGGVQYGLVADTIKAFQEAGAHYYNDAVMLLPSGSWHLRVGNFFTQSRKIARLHQPVLVFVKGDPVAATAKLGQVEWADSVEELARQGIFDGG